MSWLRQILADVVANLVRRYRRHEAPATCDWSGTWPPNWTSRRGRLGGGLAARQSSPSQQAARREQAVLLADALQQLPEAYREVIILRHLEGLPLSEVAAAWAAAWTASRTCGPGPSPGSGALRWGVVMKQTENGFAGINGLSQDSKERSGGDPRVARAVEEYQALLAAGRKPDRAEFLARYPEVAALADGLDGLDFLHAAART